MEWLWGLGGVVLGIVGTLYVIGRMIDNSMRSLFTRMSGWG